jgi:hypothetical protein
VREGDAELDRRDKNRWIVEQSQSSPGTSASGSGARLDSRTSNRNQRKLRGDKKGVRADQDYDPKELY